MGTVISCCNQAINKIPKTPKLKKPLANHNIKALFPVKLTREWALFLSIPVSASKTSLLIFSQAIIKIAEVRKIPKILGSNIAFCPKAVAVPTVIGIMATLYIGGLMAANHNFPFDGGTLDVVVIRCLVGLLQVKKTVTRQKRRTTITIEGKEIN